MSSDYYDMIEDRGAKLYAAQTARGVQYDEVVGVQIGERRQTSVRHAQVGILNMIWLRS